MRNYSNKKTPILAGLILFVVIILHYLGWLESSEKTIRSFVIATFQPTQSFSIKLGDSYQFFKNRQEFFQSYQSCIKNTEHQTVTEAKLKILTEENEQLKKQLHFQEKNNISGIIARVVGKEIASTNQNIIINKGSNDGIKINQPAIVEEGVLIGKIIKVEPDISILRLINDYQSKIGATILNRDRSLGIVEGGYGISLKMNLIPRDETILVGDQIITSGLEITIPRGLVIGTVAAIENEPYKPFQQAILTPSINLAKQTIVKVLLTY